MSASASNAVHGALGALESAQALDPPGQALGKAVRGAIPRGPVKDALSGVWLGHALHPLLTDAVTGTWVSGLLLDLLGERRGADALVAAGVACALPTAVTGASDWADAEPADPGVRRVGLVHAAGNVGALALQVASLAARRGGRRGRGIGLSLAAGALIGATGHLGGHLSYVQGVGVDTTTFDPGADEWTDAGPADAVGQDVLHATVAGETPVVVLRRGGELLALHDRCSHRGCSLATGQLDGDVVECPCHGSRFDLRDGRLLQGPATVGQPAFEVREAAGRLEVRRRPG